MNKKNKILISAAGMLILTAAAASASTFAWFTTVRNATINYSQAEVYSSSGDLTVTWKSSLMRTISHEYTDAEHRNLSVTGIHRITDISGNGQHFYKPQWNSADTSSTLVDRVTTLITSGEPNSGAPDGYYIDFTLTLSQSDSATGDMNVYVGQGSSIDPVNEQRSQDVYAANSARIAILDETSTPVFIWTPDDTNATYKYVTTETTSEPWLYPGFYYQTQTTAFDDSDNFHAGALQTYTDSDVATQDKVKPIVTLYGSDSRAANNTLSASSDITVRAWLEGEDPECKNVLNGVNALGGLFTFSLDVYGIAV